MWQIQWQLSDPSPNGGWVVQQINMTLPDGSTDTYWEAWQVAPGSTVTTISAADSANSSPMANIPIDDTFQGATSIDSSASFYEGLNLPDSFVQGGDGHAGNFLRSTKKDPCLPAKKGTPPVIRHWAPGG
jgi:hypothetical protein